MDDEIIGERRPVGLERGSPWRAFAVAGLCVVGLAAVWVVANLVPSGHREDAVALYDFTQLSRPSLDLIGNGLLSLLEPVFFAIWAIVLVVVALRRGRPRLAFAVGAIMLLSPLSSELLKPLVAHPHAYLGGYPHITAASWPSGHTTAATTLALGAVMVSPQRLRPLVAAIGGVLTVLVAFSLLMLAWHMPSDVLGGFLMGTLWASLAVGALRVAQRRHPVPARSPARMDVAPDGHRGGLSGRRHAQPRGGLTGNRRFAREGLSGAQAWGLVIAVVGVLGVMVAATHQAGAAVVVDHRALMVVASGIAVLAAACFTTVTSVLRG